MEEQQRVVDLDSYYESVPGKQLFVHREEDRFSFVSTTFAAKLLETPAPAIEDFSITSIIGGNYAVGDCRIEDKKYKRRFLIPGQSCSIIPAKHNLSWSWEAPEHDIVGPQNIGIHLSPQKLHDFFIKEFDKDPQIIELIPTPGTQDQAIVSLMMAIYCGLQDNDVYNNLYIDHLINALMTKLIAKYTTIKKPINLDKGSLCKSVINKIIEFIQDNVDKKITLDELTELTGVSSSHLCREFHKATGFTPHQYLENTRIEKASELLKNSKVSLMDVALQIGYSHSRFSTIFKKHKNMSPREFRRRAS